MVDRRRSISCVPQRPICMTIGFMFGMIVGSLLHTEYSLFSVGLSVMLGTVVFHYTFAKNFSILTLLKKVIKKGS